MWTTSQGKKGGTYVHLMLVVINTVHSTEKEIFRSCQLVFGRQKILN